MKTPAVVGLDIQRDRFEDDLAERRDAGLTFVIASSAWTREHKWPDDYGQDTYDGRQSGRCTSGDGHGHSRQCHRRPFSAAAASALPRAARWRPAAHLTGRAGKMVPLEDAIEGCEQILHDEFADYPERALYMIGTIDEAAHKER
jgi:hypothetical protein